MKLNNEAALKATLELAKINIESTEHWTEPERVIDFMQEVYTYLTVERKSADE